MERKDLMVSLVKSISDRLNVITPFSTACLTLIMIVWMHIRRKMRLTTYLVRKQ